MKRSSHWLDGTCFLQPVYVKKYVRGEQEGEICVYVRVVVVLN